MSVESSAALSSWRKVGEPGFSNSLKFDWQVVILKSDDSNHGFAPESADKLRIGAGEMQVNGRIPQRHLHGIVLDPPVEDIELARKPGTRKT